MSVVKVVKIVGQSSESFAKAAEAAVEEAAQTIRGIKSFQVDELSGEVADGKISNYRAAVEIAFLVDRGDLSNDLSGSGNSS
jgi:flavin-binding protein dodecin